MSSKPSTRTVEAVLCWDIDGTLLTTARAGVFALEEAARELLGRSPDFSSLRTAGLTDAQVAALAIRACDGHDSQSNVAAFLRSYERHLPERLHLRRGAVLPGVLDALRHLSTREDVASLLLTGNTEAGARAKLSHYGLSDYFEGGAFCVDSGDRASIARRAHRLARERFGHDLPDDRIFVIGDTPYDVECGKTIGARTMAIASGPVNYEELRACEPWLLLEAMPPPEELVELLGLSR